MGVAYGWNDTVPAIHNWVYSTFCGEFMVLIDRVKFSWHHHVCLVTCGTLEWYCSLLTEGLNVVRRIMKRVY